VKITSNICALAAAAALLTGCGGGSNGGAVPSTTQVSLASDKLQLAVGTAFNAADGTTGINVVTTFRQSNGLSAVLANTPSITGPAGFTVPSGLGGAYGATNVDIGTASITGSPQVNRTVAPVMSTLGTFTGAFSYGLAPLNSDQSPTYGYFPGNPNQTPGNGFANSSYNGAGIRAGAPWVPAGSFSSGLLPWWPLPIGALPANQGLYVLGPPAVPFFRNGGSPGGFAGYSPGFTAFEITPVAGTYTESVKITSSNAPAQTFTAPATLTSTAALPAPVVAVSGENGGGLTGTVTIGAGVTETMVFIEDTSTGAFYTVPVTGTGAQTWTLPPTLGPCNGTNCQSGAGATPSINAADSYIVTAVSFDYPALEAAPPESTSETPTITGANGQADLSTGLPVSGKY
jgi:hypothetical protein